MPRMGRTLSVEVFLLIFSHLSGRELVHMRLLSRCVKDIIDNSVSTKHEIEKSIAGVTDMVIGNISTGVTTKERLERLQTISDMWKTIRPRCISAIRSYDYIGEDHSLRSEANALEGLQRTALQFFGAIGIHEAEDTVLDIEVRCLWSGKLIAVQTVTADARMLENIGRVSSGVQDNYIVISHEYRCSSLVGLRLYVQSIIIIDWVSGTTIQRMRRGDVAIPMAPRSNAKIFAGIPHFPTPETMITLHRRDCRDRVEVAVMLYTLTEAVTSSDVWVMERLGGPRAYRHIATFGLPDALAPSSTRRAENDDVEVLLMSPNSTSSQIRAYERHVQGTPHTVSSQYTVQVLVAQYFPHSNIEEDKDHASIFFLSSVFSDFVRSKTWVSYCDNNDGDAQFIPWNDWGPRSSRCLRLSIVQSALFGTKALSSSIVYDFNWRAVVRDSGKSSNKSFGREFHFDQGSTSGFPFKDVVFSSLPYSSLDFRPYTGRPRGLSILEEGDFFVQVQYRAHCFPVDTDREKLISETLVEVEGSCGEAGQVPFAWYYLCCFLLFYAAESAVSVLLSSLM